MSHRPTELKVELVAAYLRAEVTECPAYVKSRYIAEEMDLSAKEVGVAMRRLADRDGGLQVERWANSGGITWRVSPGR